MSDEMDCPNQCNFYTQSSGESIESPEYPKKYGPNLDCKWTLEGPIGHNVILQFSEFDTERNFDTVQILSGGRTEDSAASLTTLSGRQDLTNKLFISASNFMIVKFKTDASVEKRGFRWVWPRWCISLTFFFLPFFTNLTILVHDYIALLKISDRFSLYELFFSLSGHRGRPSPKIAAAS